MEIVVYFSLVFFSQEDLAGPMLKQQGKVTKIVAIVGLSIVVLVVVIALAVVFSQKCRQSRKSNSELFFG